MKIELRSADTIGSPGETVASSTGWVVEERIVRLDSPLRFIQPGSYYLCIEGYEPYIMWLQGTMNTIRVVSAFKSTTSGAARKHHS